VPKIAQQPLIFFQNLPKSMSAHTPIRFEYIKRTLQFRFEAGTSRGVLRTKVIYWIKAFNPAFPEVVGWGEAAPLEKLSIDDLPDFELKLNQKLKELEQVSWVLEDEFIFEELRKLVPFELPSIRFGLEVALLDLKNGGKKRIFDNDFYDKSTPIPINGLIWMGDPIFMKTQIEQKLNEGYGCIKMKIGAIDFLQELELLRSIREDYSKDQILLRVDANGAFGKNDVLQKLKKLAELDIHSIEQPIAAGNPDLMQALCEASPLPIALDEELIGVKDKAKLLDQIRPPYIVLKPSLLGGIAQTKEWIKLAEEREIGWWMTSALESNIGLNAIAQLTSTYLPSLYQGLGTGKLYHNNLDSPLLIDSGWIQYADEFKWEEPS
jgi:o-succinylbenzoate synthase